MSQAGTKQENILLHEALGQTAPRPSLSAVLIYRMSSFVPRLEGRGEEVVTLLLLFLRITVIRERMLNTSFE